MCDNVKWSHTFLCVVLGSIHTVLDQGRSFTWEDQHGHWHLWTLIHLELSISVCLWSPSNWTRATWTIHKRGRRPWLQRGTPHKLTDAQSKNYESITIRDKNVATSRGNERAGIVNQNVLLYIYICIYICICRYTDTHTHTQI